MTLSKRILAWVGAALLLWPAVGEAQVRIGVGGGRGYGPGFGGPGYGYGSGYRQGYGGTGISIGFGNTGSYRYGGYGPGFGGPGYGGYYGQGFRYGSGFYQPGFSAPVYSQSPAVIYSSPLVAATPSPSVYQSFYPQETSTDGTASIVVQVPANAQMWWNGASVSTTGETRRFRTGPLSNDGATQTFQARWTGSDGQPVTQTRQIQVTPNGTFSVDFNRPEANPTSSN